MINTDFSGYGAGLINHFLVRPQEPYTEVSMQENLRNTTILPPSRRCCSVRGSSIPEEKCPGCAGKSVREHTGPGIPAAFRMIHSGQLRIFYSPAPACHKPILNNRESYQYDRCSTSLAFT